MKPKDRFELLELYLDDLLDPAGRAAFERRLADDAELRVAVGAQGRIDAGLRRSFVAPESGVAILGSGSVAGGNGASGNGKRGAERIATTSEGVRLPSRRGWLAAVAALLMVGIGVAAWVTFGKRAVEPDYPEMAYRTPEMVYRIETQKGFHPLWVCKNDQEFATTYWKNLGEPLVVKDLPRGVQAVGLSYSNTFSAKTIFLLARVGGTPVIVFADRLENDTGFGLSAESGLRSYRAEIGNLVLYEVSPLDKPVVLASFKSIEMPDGWKKS